MAFLRCQVFNDSMEQNKNGAVFRPHRIHLMYFSFLCTSIFIFRTQTASLSAAFVRKVCTFKTTHRKSLTFSMTFWISPRPISIGQLNALRHLHLQPIYLVVFKGSYFLRMGYLILRGASHLDAFSVYPCRTWLPGRALDSTTGPPAVRPSRSSRTKDSSSQISFARAG